MFPKGRWGARFKESSKGVALVRACNSLIPGAPRPFEAPVSVAARDARGLKGWSR